MLTKVRSFDESSALSGAGALGGAVFVSTEVAELVEGTGELRFDDLEPAEEEAIGGSRRSGTVAVPGQTSDEYGDRGGTI